MDNFERLIERTNMWLYVLETSFCEVTQQSKWTLPDLRHLILLHKLLNTATAPHNTAE